MGSMLLAGCAGTDENAVRIPPDDERALTVFQAQMPFSEMFWRHHFNNDETKVLPAPPPPIRATDATHWERTERPAALTLFKTILYGVMPPAPDRLRPVLLAEKTDALGGLAVRKEIRIYCDMADGRSMNFDMLLYVPKSLRRPPPVFIGLNFDGNQCNTPETDVRLTRAATRVYSRSGFRMVPTPDTWRAQKLETWNYAEAMKRGYAVATAAYGEICPDHANGFRLSPFALFYPDSELRPDYEVPFPEFKKGRRRAVSAVGAWAWGLSRMLDALEKEPSVDAARAAVIGHSRLGKAALWAGANDPRFALVISNNSGFGGATLSRRNFGAKVEIHLLESPHFFSGGLLDYFGRASELPMDQHQLLALIAPRALYVASSAADPGADPTGEFLATQAAARVWELYGLPGLGVSAPPPVNTPVGDRVRYHRKTGQHSITAYDWAQYYNCADQLFGTHRPEENRR